MEKYITEQIEEPANKVLDKIRAQKPLTSDDKSALAKYMSVMWKRVPTALQRTKGQVPGLAKKLKIKIHDDLDKAVLRDPSKAALAQQRFSEVDRILTKYESEPPIEIWHKIIPATMTPQMVNALVTMTWRFFTIPGKPAFLTCDNPVFFFDGIGIGNPDSELSFPISGNIVLSATRRMGLPEGYFPATRQIVKEMNRRVASRTNRFVFHATEDAWILPFITKGQWRLNAIQ